MEYTTGKQMVVWMAVRKDQTMGLMLAVVSVVLKDTVMVA
jgi:hypothetical protein